ncbi:MBL fold metallo-hydrolase [Chondrinema litorale]|uniref:MBL fold metallo-hydrolase n=1 Tax=Chondrinema litorale TaxID=2994555 RepID=UPI0025434D2C|nr:MBL fold metallo-hydrolase [Chondrinema litorale]UZR96914.1 MBL fold metallo-hydrolase [Chondrinema litorale]
MTLLHKSSLILLALFSASSSQAQELTNISYDDTLLAKIRSAAQTIPGKKATELHYIKFAESPRTYSATVEGGDETPYIQARTAYQVMFEDGWIMVDAGMDKKVHQFFGKGKQQPYFSDKNEELQAALVSAKKILITHEHGDHIAGVLRTDSYKEIAPKTILTKQQINTLINNPQMPELKMETAQLKDFTVVDFEDVLPVAPGIVLIKAPGHTPGEIMVYIQFETGKEYLITGDVSWSYVGIKEKKQKPESQRKRIGEDAEKIQFELNWLNGLPEKNIQLIVNHDDIIQPELVELGILKEGFKTNL